MNVNCCITRAAMMCTNNQCYHQTSINIVNGRIPSDKQVCPKCGFKSLDTHMNALLMMVDLDVKQIDGHLVK